jgi:uncharacterized membrane protein
LVLFLGSGFLDFGLKLNQQFFLNSEDYFAFVSTVFFSAFTIGLVFGIVTKRFVVLPRNVLAGIGLGLPNYFSIYFIMMALNLEGLESTIVFPINNSGILVLSTLLGFLIFKEKLSLKNGLGITLCVAGILLISLSL